MTGAKSESRFTSVEICAGAGGQAVGLHEAGFRHLALIEIDADACQTLRDNVEHLPGWRGCRVINEDLKEFDTAELKLKRGSLDLLAGGVPCPPFSFAGRQLGADDERDLFPTMLRMVKNLKPKAVMIENVRDAVREVYAETKRKDDTVMSTFNDLTSWNLFQPTHARRVFQV